MATTKSDKKWLIVKIKMADSKVLEELIKIVDARDQMRPWDAKKRRMAMEELERRTIKQKLK